MKLIKLLILILVTISINLIFVSSSVYAQQQIPNSHTEKDNNNIQNNGEIPKPIVHVTIEGTVNDDKMKRWRW